MKQPDLISIIERSYDVTVDDAAWREGILAAARPSLDRGLGILGYLYDFNAPGPSGSGARAFTTSSP